MTTVTWHRCWKIVLRFSELRASPWQLQLWATHASWPSTALRRWGTDWRIFSYFFSFLASVLLFQRQCCSQSFVHVLFQCAETARSSHAECSMYSETFSHVIVPLVGRLHSYCVTPVRRPQWLCHFAEVWLRHSRLCACSKAFDGTVKIRYCHAVLISKAGDCSLSFL